MPCTFLWVKKGSSQFWTHPDILELGAGLLGNVQVFPQSRREAGVLHLEQIGIGAILVAAENIIVVYRGVIFNINLRLSPISGENIEIMKKVFSSPLSVHLQKYPRSHLCTLFNHRAGMKGI